MKDLAEFILSSKRERCKDSWAEMSRKTGVHLTTLHDLKNGSKASAITLGKLSIAFGVTMPYLEGLNDNQIKRK